MSENENLPPIEDSPNVTRFRVHNTTKERIAIARELIINTAGRLINKALGALLSRIMNRKK